MTVKQLADLLHVIMPVIVLLPAQNVIINNQPVEEAELMKVALAVVLLQDRHLEIWTVILVMFYVLELILGFQAQAQEVQGLVQVGF
jgi:hypothetical protein